MMNHPLASSASLLVVALLAGCAQKGPQAVPIKAADSYASKTQADGLVAGAEPFDTYRKSTHALGRNVSREFTPVQLVVESAASDKFLVHREGAKLLCTDGTTLEPVSALKMFEHYRPPLNAAEQWGFARPA